MMKRSHRRNSGRTSRSVLFAAATLVLAACGGSADSPAAPAPSPSPGGSADQIPDVAFTMAFPSIPSVSDVAILKALDDMKERGYNANYVILAEPELAAEGLARNEFQFMVGGGVSALIAIQQGAPVRMIGSRAGNEWALISASDITECSDLDGRRLGIHSEGGVSTAMVRAYVAVNCPQSSPQYLIVSGSGNRAQAMQAGELDASPLQLDDIANLEAAGELDFVVLANLVEDLPQLVNAAFYGNTQFMEANPDVTIELIRTQVEIHRRINSDPSYLVGLINEYVEDFDQSIIEAVAEQYSSLEIFGSDGGLVIDDVAWSLGFFNEFGFISEIMEAGSVADVTYLEAAVSQLG